MKYVWRTGSFKSGNPRLYYRPPGNRNVPLPDAPKDSDEMRAAYLEARELYPATRDIHPAKASLAQVLRNAKTRAASAALPFDLTLDGLEKLFDRQKARCALSNLPFDAAWKGDSGRRPFAPSLDKIDPPLGYVESNIRLVCTIANLARADFGDDAFRRLCRAVANMPRTPLLKDVNPCTRKAYK